MTTHRIDVAEVNKKNQELIDDINRYLNERSLPYSLEYLYSQEHKEIGGQKVLNIDCKVSIKGNGFEVFRMGLKSKEFAFLDTNILANKLGTFSRVWELRDHVNNYQKLKDAEEFSNQLKVSLAKKDEIKMTKKNKI